MHASHFGFKLRGIARFPLPSVSLLTMAAELPPTHPRPCVVSQQEGLNQFEAAFADPVARTTMTRTFFLYEPVLYQPSHLAQPVLTHIAFIAKDHFVVAASTTDRMVPISQAQKVLKFKLTLEDVEKELYGKSLSGGERLVWRRWVDDQNRREGRKSRLRAPCCGKSTFLYKLVPDERGYLCCKHCSDASYAKHLYAEYWAQNYPQSAHHFYGHENDTSSSQEDTRSGPPPWRTPQAKRQKVVMSPEDLNAALLCTQQSV